MRSNQRATHKHSFVTFLSVLFVIYWYYNLWTHLSGGLPEDVPIKYTDLFYEQCRETNMFSVTIRLRGEAATVD